MPTNLKCLACSAGETGAELRNVSPVGVTSDLPFLNGLVMAEVYGLERVVSALCHQHGAIYRESRNVADGRAKAAES
jgi:hypothetical protein